MRLKRGQQQATHRLTRMLKERNTLTGVAHEIPELQQSLIGWDGYRLFSIHPESLEIERLIASSRHDPELRLGWLRTGYHNAEANPPSPFGFRERLESGVRADSLDPRLDLCHGMPAGIRSRIDADAYAHDVLGRYASHFQGLAISGFLPVGFPARGRAIATLQGYRAGSGKGFSTTEVAVERQTILPELIWAPLAQVREFGVTVASRIRLSAGSATVHAAPGGGDRSVALVIAATRSVEVTPNPARWTLTAAEERVAALVVQRNGNREIAATLSISEHSVEWHLRRNFEKLGIRSRVQLSARYYADAR